MQKDSKWRELLGQEHREGIALERALLDIKRRQVTACFVRETLPDEGLLLALKRMLERAFAQCSVKVRVSCPALREDFLRDVAAYTPYLQGRLVERVPGAAPFLRDATWEIEQEVLTIYTKGEAGASYLTERGCADVLAALIKELFGMQMAVRFGSVEGSAQDAQGRERQDRLMDAIAQEMRLSQQKKKAREEQQDSILYGKKVNGSATPLGELSVESGSVIIEGKVIATQVRLLKGNTRLLLTFGVTDYTGSIACKVFMAPEDEKQAHRIVEGMGVRVRGDCNYDSFSKEIAIIARDIQQMRLPTREDHAQVKRVELHMHSQMSALDGVVRVGDLLRRAAAWGHEAIAVTDHGVVQAFPEAFDTVAALAKQGSPIKFIPGVEGYLVDDDANIARGADEGLFERNYVVLDVETTGLSPARDRLTEIAAVRMDRQGKIIEEYSTLVNPERRIPERIIKLTGITDEMVADAPSQGEAVRGLIEFLGEDMPVAHNASFDMGFLSAGAQRAGLSLPADRFVDTLPLARALLPHMKSYKLNLVCKELGIQLKNHHRAIFDTRATAQMFVKLLDIAQEKDIKTLDGLNAQLGTGVSATGTSNHIILLAANAKGLFNLYKLISLSHLEHYYRRPRIPRSLLTQHREGLIIGSACEAGEVFQAIMSNKPEREIERIARFYDYLEIQPTGNNAFMVRDGIVKGDEELRELNQRIVELGDKLNLPVCATCDVHFLDPEDAIFREILMNNKNFADAAFQAPLYLRTTQEMLEEFAYLGEEKAYEVVVTNTRAIAQRIEEPRMFPEHPRGELTFQPKLPGAEQSITDAVWAQAKSIYGDTLPDIVNKRIEKELKSIIGNGFATLYRSAQMLVQKSNEDGYLVGSRGSIGSSLVATLLDVTEVNPLPPHYVCPTCKHSNFDVDAQAYPAGPDLPHATCPQCDIPLSRAGYDIPFEVFLGFEGEKVPDIDLNFSGDYQAKAQAYVKEIFGDNNVYKAGTIGTLAQKKAYGEVLGFLERTGRAATSVEKERLVKGITGVKVSTGQHPGGMVVVPAEYDIHAFSPIQYPADKAESGIITTHFDFGSLHDILVKLDILGHDDPTMIHMLEELTDTDAKQIDLTDAKVMSLFVSTQALGVTPEQIDSQTGTLGIPEFGTKFVRGMLEETQPNTMAELIRISGLSHGTNVWLNNAQDMIREGVATLKECFCTRDDIMNALIGYGVEAKMAFTIMEIVRKGNAKKALTAAMEKAMKDAGVPQIYIDSCYKIEYMFPKAHAAAYVMMALRVAYYKVNYPLAYYTAYFTVRADEFDAAMMCAPPEQLRTTMKEIAGMEGDSAKNERLITLLEIVVEMRERGFDFAPMDLYASHASLFQIKDGAIRPPLNSLSGVGGTAAEGLVAAREGEAFLSVEDLQKRAHVSRAVIDALRQTGCLRDLPETSQISLF